MTKWCGTCKWCSDKGECVDPAQGYLKPVTFWNMGMTCKSWELALACSCENQRALIAGEYCENCGGVAR